MTTDHKDHPPLPEPNYTRYGAPSFTTAQMHAYIEADRAQRAAPAEVLGEAMRLAERYRKAEIGAVAGPKNTLAAYLSQHLCAQPATPQTDSIDTALGNHDVALNNEQRAGVHAAIRDLCAQPVAGAEPVAWMCRVTEANGFVSVQRCSGPSADGAFPVYAAAPPAQAEPVAWLWRYDSVGGAVTNRPVVTETPEPTIFLRNVFARGPWPLYAGAPPARTAVNR